MYGKMTLRKKIALLLTLCVLTIACAVGFFVYRNERRQIIEDNSEMLSRYLVVFAETGEKYGARALPPMFDMWRRAYPDGRITLIDYDGKVIYDSRTEAENLDNHYKRPEVISAFNTGAGSELRLSKTTGEWENYLARRFADGGHIMVVRLSYPVSELDGLVGRMAQPFIYSIEIILLLVWGGAYWMLRQIMKPLASLSRAAETIASGGSARFPISSDAEIQNLSNALNSMSDSLRLGAIEATRRKDEIARLMGALPVGVILMDKDKKLSFMNDSAAKLCGKPDGAFHSGAAIEIVLPSAEMCAMLDAPDGSRLILMQRRGGMQVEATTLTTAAGRILMLQDLTEELRLNEARREFFVDAGHEFQTPLTVIRTGLELLKLGGSLKNEEDAKSVDTMLRQQERMSRLVDDMLLLVRLDSSPLSDDSEKTNLASLVGDVIAEVKLLPDAASLEITADEPETGAEVAGRFQDLRRALLNLAENGVKYVSSVRESGGRVDVAVADGGSQWCITVDDNGPGIPDADRVKIFERFTRGDGHRARGKAATGGYGLGLAISRRTAERLGGSLELGESELGGAAFVMKLPKA